MDGRLYNCAALVRRRAVRRRRAQELPAHHQRVLRRALVHPGRHVRGAARSTLGGATVPFGADLLFRAEQHARLRGGIEICEDLWAVNPPSGDMALAGATLLLNRSASNELLGKADYRRDLVRQQSARCLAAYLYAGGRAGRIDHRPGVCRPLADRRERQRCWPRPSASTSTRRWWSPTSTCSGWSTSGCRQQQLSQPAGAGAAIARIAFELPRAAIAA